MTTSLSMYAGDLWTRGGCFLAVFMRDAEGGKVTAGDLRWVQGSIDAVARSRDKKRLFPKGDGETPCLKVRSDEVQDGASWRSQASIGPCGFTRR